ncbi:MAG: PAS domain-containing protein [Thermodesulfobacteriota bacterium]
MTPNLSQEQLNQQIVAEARDAIIFADQEGIIRLWNRGAVEIFGYPAKTALGQPLDLIIPETLRERHNQAYERVMASGRTKYSKELLAVPGLRQDGSRISLEFTITLVKDDQDRVLGAAAIIRDVTDRWHKEKERQKRLADLEARLASLTASKAEGAPVKSAGRS